MSTTTLKALYGLEQGNHTSSVNILTVVQQKEIRDVLNQEMSYISMLNYPTNGTLSATKITPKTFKNKTVLLRERKRHTDRGVSSSPSAVMCWGGGGGHLRYPSENTHLIKMGTKALLYKTCYLIEKVDLIFVCTSTQGSAYNEFGYYQ